MTSPPPPVEPGQTCVLVGNGPSATMAGLGKVIDAFDEIIRFNHYAITGFEQGVGTRTTIWTTFGRGMLPQTLPPPAKAIFIHGENGIPAYEPAQLWRVPISYFQQLRTGLRELTTPERRETIIPSSGLLVICWLLEQGATRLHLIGFDHFQKNRSSQHHYWMRQSFGRPREHDGDAEEVYLRPFVQQRKVCYLA